VLILNGLQMDISTKVLAEIIRISPSALSRRYDATRLKVCYQRKHREACVLAHSATQPSEHPENRKIEGLTPVFVFAVSEEFRERYPQVQWRAITGMRHKIVHDYMFVDEDIVWSTVTKELAPLIADLEKIISEESNEGD